MNFRLAPTAASVLVGVRWQIATYQNYPFSSIVVVSSYVADRGAPSPRSARHSWIVSFASLSKLYQSYQALLLAERGGVAALQSYALSLSARVVPNALLPVKKRFLLCV